MMELMYSRAIPEPEFASLSILLRSDISGGDAAPISCHLGGGGEPFLLSGPLSTISRASCKEALTELHLYINAIFKASSSSSKTKDTAANARYLQEDEKFLFGNRSTNAKNNDFATQIFRPQKCHGMALQYSLIRDRKQISSFLVPLILNSSKDAAGVSAGIEMKEVTGVIFCVGMGGGPVATFGVGTTSLTYSLGHRMKRSLGILCNETTTTSISNNKKRNNVTPPAVMDLNLARSLLTTLLLTNDEDRMVNSIVNGEQRIDISQEDQFTKRILKLGSKKKGNQAGMGSGGEDNDNPLVANSADQARIIVERMAVLSVCSSDSILRKYEIRQAVKDAASAGKTGKKRLRKLAGDADLDGFDFRGEKRSSSLPNLDVSNHSIINDRGGDDTSVSGGSTFTSASHLSLKGPKKDTAAKSFNTRARLPSPGLSRARLQQSPGLLASNSKDSNRRTSATDPSPGKARNVLGRRKSFRDSLPGGVAGSGGQNQANLHNNFSTAQPAESFDHNFGRQQFDPFSDNRGQSNDIALASESAFGHQDMPIDGPSSGTKALINVALNEDLTCFYKLSKLSSCSVEGVVQVQVRSNVDRAVPFSLLIKDPSNYIQTIQENKMYAKSVADKTKKSDFAFAVSVPKAEEYFPVMRYKCGEDLRPVPIVSANLLCFFGNDCFTKIPFSYLLSKSCSAGTNPGPPRRKSLESGPTD